MSELLNLIDLRYDFVAEKLANHTITAAGCWEYQGFRDKPGYGRISLGGRSFGAHRLSYAFHNGVDPGKLLVCHKCDNPPCFNPDHLFLGTIADNAADMVRKNRQHKQLGETNSNRKLDEPLVLDIVAKIKQGMSNTAIARTLPVTHHQVSLIRLGRNWADLLKSIGYVPADHRLKTHRNRYRPAANLG